MSRVLLFIFCNIVALGACLSSEIICSLPQVFKCKNGKCIPPMYKCNKEDDCGDGSDEENCDHYQPIKCDRINYFECKNRVCIANVFKCNGLDDCGDNSDEENCENSELTSRLHNCTQDEFQCKNKFCIPVEDFCDTQVDCVDGSDEYQGCELMLKQMPCSGFRCKSGICISDHWRCDGSKDCPDGSDESDCEDLQVQAKDCNATVNGYLCKNKRCISLNLTCNENNDCGDNSDEGGDCRNVTKGCNSIHCNQICTNTPQGAVCSCRPGFIIENNKCVDINECANYGTCSQYCYNTFGSYHCQCDSGYKLLEDGKSCKAKGDDSFLLFSSRTEIRKYVFETKDYFSVARNLRDVLGLAYDSMHIYWTSIDSGIKEIMKSKEDGSNVEMIATSGLDSPEDLVVDRVTGNVYFTDAGYRQIGVCKNDGSYCTVLIVEKTTTPKGITLYSFKGLMYWSSWGEDPHISVAGMDGKDDKIFIEKNLHWPSGLVIDTPKQRLYWVDSKLQTVESILLDGTDRRMVLKDVLKRPYSIELFEDNLYFTDWYTNAIHSCNKFTGKDFKTLIMEKNIIYDLHVYNPALRSKYRNPCFKKPCSQLCLLAVNRTYSCACTLDHELTLDKHTCKESAIRYHMIIAAGNKIIKYFHQLLGKPTMFSNETLKHITHITYDPINDNGLATDSHSNSIFSFNIHTHEIKTILDVTNQYISSMDFDYIGNNLYWLNTEFNLLEIYSMKTQSKIEHPFANEPHNIAVVPEKGIMYIVFKLKSKEFYIKKYNMTGVAVNEKSLDTGKLIGPKISLAYDFEAQRLYWADEGTGRIESISDQDNDKILFRTGLAKPMSIAVVGDFVFWTEHGSKQLFATNKTASGRIEEGISIKGVDNVDTMLVMSLRSKLNEKHACHQESPCSHLCIPTGENNYECQCPYQMDLKKDRHTCEIRLCKTDEWNCVRTGHCIEASKKCDGNIDCIGGEDEINCFQNFTCSSLQFRCTSGQCVNIKSRCDSIFDCSDKSDEQNCVTKPCEKDEFLCHDRSKCIKKSLLCNEHNDCSDASDEMNCEEFSCDPDNFKCKTSGMCIPKNWECDGEKDCQDGSDESDSCLSFVCSPTMFKCENEHCLDTRLVCNGYNDCGDNSDEARCLHNKKVENTTCTADQYKCNGIGTCIHQNMRCNDYEDCPDGDDEIDCVQCSVHDFKCENSKCIPFSWVCDNEDDCHDNSDEKHCTDTVHGQKAKPSSNSCEEYKCNDGACLPYAKLCDNNPDCFDKSDEGGHCGTSCNLISPCEQMCLKSPKGPICKCQDGYELLDGKSCKDIDECNGPHDCHQTCVNTLGSYKCDCYSGYSLRSDGKTCKSTGSPMKLITSSNEGITKFSLGGMATNVLISDMYDDISGLDVDIEKNVIYWSNENMQKIMKYNITSERKREISLVNPDRLAVDWATDNVYVYCKIPEANIKVCNFENNSCATIIPFKNVGNVFAFIVDPVNGYLFWSLSNHDAFTKSEVYRAELTGLNKTNILTGSIGIITGLAVDYPRSRLYYADAALRLIESSDFDGGDRRLVYQESVYQPIELNIFEDHFYWLSGITGKIQKCPLLMDNISEPVNFFDCETLDIGTSHIHKFFFIMQKSRQPFVKNRCEGQHCDQMCVLSKESFACICEHGNPLRINVSCTDLDPQLRKEITVPKKKYSYNLYYIFLIPFVIILFVFFLYARLRNRDLNVSIRSILQRININRASNFSEVQNSSGESNLVGREFENPMFQNELTQSLTGNILETDSRVDDINLEQAIVTNLDSESTTKPTFSSGLE